MSLIQQLLDADFSANWTHSGGARIYVHYNGSFIGEIHFYECGWVGSWYFDKCDGKCGGVSQDELTGDQAEKMRIKISNCK